MLPALTVAARERRPPRRALAGAAGVTLLLVALLLVLRGDGPAAAPGLPIRDVLPPGTWAMAIPTTWLSAPTGVLRPGDHVDVLALRPGERATATAIAFDLLVVSADDHAIVVGTGAEDATALGVARASGLLLIPLLRSTR
jgi:hypothetical protein